MKNRVKAALLLMAIFTVIYVSAVVYAQTNYYEDVVYAAIEYESIIPPTDWYEPGHLGIVRIIEREGGWLHTVVDREKEPFPLQRENPVFLYKEELYQVSSLWFTPSLLNPRWEVPIGGMLGAAWVFTGVLYIKGRKG